MRPEHLHCPNTAEGIRRINDMQEAYDRDPAKYEEQERQAKEYADIEAQAQAEQARYEAEQHAQAQAEYEQSQQGGY